MAVTINCDMGESFGLYRMGDDQGMMPLIHIANVACGFHGSDFNHMRSTVRLAKAHGVDDRVHFLGACSSDRVKAEIQAAPARINSASPSATDTCATNPSSARARSARA